MKTNGPGQSRRQFLHCSARAGSALAVLPWIEWPAPRLFDRTSDRPHLDIALRAAEWMWALRRPTEAGVTWPWDAARPDGVQLSLYTGTPGVVLFLGELHAATGEVRFLEEMRAGALELAARLAAGEVTGHGLYVGRAGAGYTLHRAAEATGDERLHRAAEHAFQEVIAGARPVGGGVAWPQPGQNGEVEVTDVVSGAAGSGLGLLYAQAALGDDRALETAVAAGRRLAELGQEADGGVKWAMSASFPRLMPNFSHGTAGVAYYLARLAEVTGERTLLESAEAGGRYLRAAMTLDSEGGWTIFHHEPEGEELFYLSWCHGPVGTSRLFHTLGRVTGDLEWDGLVHRGALGVMNTGIPESRTPGFWNNVSQCCGTAGVGEFFLDLHRSRHDLDADVRGRYAAFLDRLTADLTTRSTTREGRTSWTQAEHRVRPELLQAQTGFMQGAAGMATYFLHLDAREAGRDPWLVLPDSPWGSA